MTEETQVLKACCSSGHTFRCFGVWSQRVRWRRSVNGKCGWTRRWYGSLWRKKVPERPCSYLKGLWVGTLIPLEKKTWVSDLFSYLCNIEFLWRTPIYISFCIYITHYSMSYSKGYSTRCHSKFVSSCDLHGIPRCLAYLALRSGGRDLKASGAYSMAYGAKIATLHREWMDWPSFFESKDFWIICVFSANDGY